MALQGFFPLLTDPFPAPELEVTTVPREGAGRPIGVGITDCYREGANRHVTLPHHVRISIVQPHSPFRNTTTVAVGQQLLAVNGTAVESAKQGANEIRSSTSRAMTFWTAEPVSAPYCRHFCFNLDQASAGSLTFGPACGGRLVQITRVAKQGPLSGLVAAGDIVLAVNGTSVSSPDMASQVLRRAVLEATQNDGRNSHNNNKNSSLHSTTATTTRTNGYSTSPSTSVCMSLYLVEIQALRRSLTHQVIAHFLNSGQRGAADWKKIQLRYNAAPTDRSIPSDGGTVSFKVHGQMIAESLGFDPDTLRMKDMVGPLLPTTNKVWSALGYRGMASWKYDTMVVPFIDRYNTLLDLNLGPLCDAVASEVQHDEANAVVGGNTSSEVQSSSTAAASSSSALSSSYFSEPIAVDRLYGDEMRHAVDRSYSSGDEDKTNFGEPSWQSTPLVEVDDDENDDNDDNENNHDSHDPHDDSKENEPPPEKHNVASPQNSSYIDMALSMDSDDDEPEQPSDLLTMTSPDPSSEFQLEDVELEPVPTTEKPSPATTTTTNNNNHRGGGGMLSFMAPRITT